MFLVGLSLLAGILTVLAPCTLPLLPVIVGGTAGDKLSLGRTLAVIGSLGASLFLFTLLLKVSTALANVPPAVWSTISGVLILAFGLVTLFPGLWDRLPIAGWMNRRSNKVIGQGYLKKSISGDVLIGAALGPVFSSCSPTYFIILATVLPVSLALGIIYLLIYIAGLCLALLAIALLGQRLVGALGVAADPSGWFKRAIGILFIGIGVAILFGYDKKIENTLSTHAGALDVTRIEQAALQSQATSSEKAPVVPGLSLAEKAKRYPMAPELAAPDAYLNTDGKPITLSQYRGKNVVFIDFWTYSCINCQRTIPYLNAWYQKYKDQGLVIIGVHTPEFAFEHVQTNVQAALKQFGIEYPVVLDNEYGTWNAFGNQFWPREYLIDIDGFIVHDHAGEGEYDVTEKAIQAALKERADRLGGNGPGTSTVSIAPADLSGVGSPETYFGAERNDYLANGDQHQVGIQNLVFPDSFSPNHLYLSGTWNFDREFATASAGSEVAYHYSSKNVYLVASADSPADIEVLQDGKPIGNAGGKDVSNGVVTIGGSRLYHLVANGTPGEHVLTLKVRGAIRFYTFTFG